MEPVGENMIVRVGVDIISVHRVRRVHERWGERFLSRVFTPQERSYCGTRVESLAARFAAKEAIAKALGTGVGDGICWRDLEVTVGANGPQVCLHNAALARAQSLGLHAWSLSLAHSDGVAIAVAVGYGVGEEEWETCQ